VAAILLRSVSGWTFAALLNIVAMFMTVFAGFSDMVAAQIIFGIFGLGGGLSHALLIKSAGAKLSLKHGFLFSVIWALSCIGGVTPLFFVMGTGLKMGMLTFYSFAFSGAVGGLATALVMKSLFPHTSSHKVIPCAAVWSFSLGLGAIAGDSLGQGLEIFFPWEVAWPVSALVMGLILGCGGGLSTIRFLSTEGPYAGEISSKSGRRNASYVLTAIILCVPFYLNDFSNIYVTDWRLWLLIDYTGVKLLPFIVVLWLLVTKRMALTDFGLKTEPVVRSVAVFLIGTLSVTFILQNGHLMLQWLPGYAPLGKMPEIGSPLWRWIDLTIGLLMVGIVEELVFRGYLYTFIRRYTWRPSIIVGVSAMAFGLIHWSDGFHSVVLTALAGAVFMLLYLQTLSLPAIMLSHFMVDFIAYAGVIPKTIFNIF
jgi:uncharacterized protein